MKNSLPLLALYVYIVNENFFCTTFHHITASLLDALLWGRNWSALWAWKAEAQDAYLHFSLLLGKRMRLIAAPTQPTNLTSCIMNMQLVRPCDNNTKWATWVSFQMASICPFPSVLVEPISASLETTEEGCSYRGPNATYSYTAY